MLIKIEIWFSICVYTFCKSRADIYKEVVEMSDYFLRIINFDSVYIKITCEFILDSGFVHYIGNCFPCFLYVFVVFANFEFVVTGFCLLLISSPLSLYF